MVIETARPTGDWADAFLAWVRSQMTPEEWEDVLIAIEVGCQERDGG